MILKGDRVTLFDCGEAGFPDNKDRSFKVTSDPFDLCGTECVTIESEHPTPKRYASFATEFLMLR